MSKPPGHSHDRPSICLVAHMAYGAMKGCKGHIGGVERQTTMMARWLAAHGWRVSLITWREGPPHDEVIDGVQVIKVCAVADGWPVLRFVHPRWTSLNDALAKANADLYYHNSAECVTGQVAWWCRRNGRRFIFSTANDGECDPRLPQLRLRRERLLYRYGIRAASCLITQTHVQRTAMREGFGLDSVVLPMPCIRSTPADEKPVPPVPPYRVVWVARIARVKRLEWLLDMAQALPELRFEVAGQPDPENDYTRGLVARAATLPNVHLLGAVPRDRMAAVYRGALCLCNTSLREGFPNTFLEAWSQGIPVVSIVDPDGLIAREGLGGTGHDQGGLAQAITRLTDPEQWATTSNKARAHFAQFHDYESAMKRFEDVFRALVGARQ